MDVMKSKFHFGVVGCALTLTVMLPIHCMIMIGKSSQNCTKDGGHHHSLGVDPTSFGLDFGSKFMVALASFQVSFGPNLRMFKSSENHSNSLDYQCYPIALHGHTVHPAVDYVPNPVEQIPLLSRRKTPPDIFTKLTSAWSSGELH